MLIAAGGSAWGRGVTRRRSDGPNEATGHSHRERQPHFYHDQCRMQSQCFHQGISAALGVLNLPLGLFQPRWCNVLVSASESTTAESRTSSRPARVV